MNIRVRLMALCCFVIPAWCGANGELEAAYRQGRTFAEFLADVDQYQALWRDNWNRSRLPADVARDLERLSGEWRILAITEAACLDSANSLPYVARLAESTSHLDLRVRARDEVESLLDERPGDRGVGAVPTLILLDPEGEEVGCWIEQPGAQRELQLTELDPLPPGRKRSKAVSRYLEWYEQDAGASVLRELMVLLDAAERGARGCRAGTGGVTTADSSSN